MSTPNNKQAGGFTPGPWFVHPRYGDKGTFDIWTRPDATDGAMWIADAKPYGGAFPDVATGEANARLIAATPDLFTERQQISAELGRMEWTTPHEAERLLRDFIEQFYYSEAAAKATGTARLDKAVEAMAEGRAS